MEILSFFLEKRPITVKFPKICFENLHGDTNQCCRVQIWWNVADGKSCVAYL